MADIDAAAKVRRAYGRGYHDGIRAANEQETMSKSNQAEIERGLSSISKKVLDCVPIQEAWPSHRISEELLRRGSKQDLKTVTGCLSSMKDAGIVREPHPGQFQRLMPKIRRVPPAGEVFSAPETDEAQRAQTLPSAEQAQDDKPKDTLTKLCDLSADLRTTSSCLLALATRVDDIAIEVEERILKAQNGAVKLKQLQDLLKDIGGGE